MQAPKKAQRCRYLWVEGALRQRLPLLLRPLALQLLSPPLAPPVQPLLHRQPRQLAAAGGVGRPAHARRKGALLR